MECNLRVLITSQPMIILRGCSMQRVLVYTAMLTCLIDVFQRVGNGGLIDVVITVAYTKKGSMGRLDI